MILSTSSGTPGTTSRMGTISPCVILPSNTTSLRPFHMRLPAMASQSSTPAAKMSVRRSTLSPRACSGDM